MQSQDDDSRELTGNGKYAVAGLGAASSLLVPLYFVDLEIIVSNLRIAFASDFSGILLIIAYLIRFSLFVGAGIFWIWAFNRSERNAWKIFQLGIVAPAILTGADQSEQRNDLLDAARQVQQSSYLLMSPAFADEAESAIRGSEPSPIESLSWWEVVKSGFLVEPLDDPVRRLVQETEDAKELTNSLEAEISALSEERSHIEGLNEDLRETISNLEEVKQILTDRNQTLIAEIRNLSASAARAMSREGDLESQMSELEGKIRVLAERAEAPERELEEDRLNPEEMIVQLWDAPTIMGSLEYGGVTASTFERGEDLDLAIAYYQDLAKLAENEEYLLGVVAAYANLAVVATLMEADRDTVETYEQRKADVLRSIGREESDMISTYAGLGVTDDLKKHLEAAREYHLEALKLARQREFSWGTGAAYLDLGVLAYMGNAMKESEDLFMQALEAFGDVGPLGKAMTYNNLGVLYETTGREEQALEYERATEGALESLKP